MFLQNDNYNKEDVYSNNENYSYEYDDEEEKHNNSFNFNDDDILNNLDNNQMPSKQIKAKATTMKKKKKPIKLFNIGDIVIYRKKQATVVFGPFEKNYKQVYELQMEDGSVVSAISDSIRKQ